jgi:hypothetical protein
MPRKQTRRSRKASSTTSTSEGKRKEVPKEEEQEEKRHIEGMEQENKAQEEETPAKKKKTKEEKIEKEDITETAQLDWLKDENILEMGHIYFFYRPRVSHEEVQSESDVSRLYILLKPFKDDKQHHEMHKSRLILLGKKHLPHITSHERLWGFVDKVSDNIKDIVESKFEATTYETETRGERKIEEMRPAGEGVYGLVRHHRGVVLGYVLELPEEISEVQKAFNIKKEATFYISIKNPETAASPGLPHREGVKLPKELQDKFAGRKWLPVDPPSFMNCEGAELLFIGARKDVVEELGKEGEEIEEEADLETHKGGHMLKAEDLYKQLRMKKEKHPIEPIKRGTWA